jgi:hypothetical protein
MNYIAKTLQSFVTTTLNKKSPSIFNALGDVL